MGATRTPSGRRQQAAPAVDVSDIFGTGDCGGDIAVDRESATTEANAARAASR